MRDKRARTRFCVWMHTGACVYCCVCGVFVSHVYTFFFFLVCALFSSLTKCIRSWPRLTQICRILVYILGLTLARAADSSHCTHFTRAVYREENRTAVYRDIFCPYRYFPTVYRRPRSHVMWWPSGHLYVQDSMQKLKQTEKRQTHTPVIFFLNKL